MKRLTRLISAGYLPHQLPPCFTSELLADKAKKLLAALPATLKGLPITLPENFSQARAGHKRRPLAIPNPANQLSVCREINSYWTKIQKHQKNSKLSLSKTKLQSFGERAIEIFPLGELREERLRRSAGYKYILQSDLQQFFPTLYTHVIPWALHGKGAAKKNQSAISDAFYGNRLDRCVRSGQSNQTIGIPIGPDTSHVIAEIVGTSIDVALADKLGEWPMGYRHVDDFFLCFETQVDAEKGLSALVESAREFECHVNINKTKIIRVDDYQDEDWAHRIARLDISFDKGSQQSDILQYFEEVSRIARQTEDETVIKFALRRATAFLIWPDNWKIFEAYLARLATIYPNNLETVAHIFSTYRSLGYDTDKKLISRICFSIIREHGPIEHHSELAWALWLCLEFGIKVPTEIARIISSTRSSVCALLALRMRDLGLIKSGLDTTLWKQALSLDGLNDGHWMLSYESAIKGWLNPKVDYIANHPFFSALRANDVHFFDLAGELTPLISRERLPDDFDPEFDPYDHVEGEYGYTFSEDAEKYID